MNLRRTLVLLIVALLLGGYVYWQDRVAGDRERSRADAKKLLGLVPGEIQGIRIRHSGQLFDLIRKDESWVLAQPVLAPCDPDEIAAFLDTLASARLEEEIGRGPLARYGLDAPAARLEIDTGTQTRKLALGRVNPLQTMVYVLVDDSESVILTTSALLSISLNNTFGWRDKRMIDVPPDSVYRVRVRGQGEEHLVITRHPDHSWRVDGGTPWRVDPIRSQSLLFALCQLEASGVSAENKENPGQFGLGSRRNGVLLETQDGRVIGDLIWGTGKLEGSVHALVPDKPEIFRIDMKIIELLSSLTSDPRDRKVLPPFDPSKVTRVEVKTPDDEFVLERRSIHKWVSVMGADTLALDPGKVLGMLEDLALMKIDEFPTEQSRGSLEDSPSIRVLLYEGESRVSGVEVGQRDPGGINTFARGPDEPAHFLLSPVHLIQLPIDLDRLKIDEETASENDDLG